MGPENNNLEVKLYWDKIYGMLVQEMENISGSKTRSLARTASIKLKPQTPQLCETRVTVE